MRRCDIDDDVVDDSQDEFPNGPNRRGDDDQDGCDDCSSGTYDPANDREGADGDGQWDEVKREVSDPRPARRRSR